LQQLESAGQVADLEQALNTVQQLELQRAELWQQAAHDLRGNLGVVSMVTAGLSSPSAPGEAKARFLSTLDRNVQALHRLLEDVTSLARLQGGQEHRVLAPMDASDLLRQLAASLQAAAEERQLELQIEGPAAFVVEGDAVKICRIVQNLVLNAIKYTRQGGVSLALGPHVSGEEPSLRWFIRVTDTGPGLHAGTGAALTHALDVATEQATEMAEGHHAGEITHIPSSPLDLTPVAANPAAPALAPGPAGEGIGLSIVKRLCSLLDATLEVQTEVGQGTSFRILLPTRYPPAVAAAAAGPAGPAKARSGSTKPV
jgi:signal transduction histidine kinase